MIKSKLISHIQELESIRQDKYMPDTIHREVEALQLKLTQLLELELTKRSDTIGATTTDIQDLVDKL